jgi:hypothetical protein
MYGDRNGKEQSVKDALGHPRYFHRKGDRHNARAFLTVQKANRGNPGSVEVYFEGALYTIHDPLKLKGYRPA